MDDPQGGRGCRDFNECSLSYCSNLVFGTQSLRQVCVCVCVSSVPDPPQNLQLSCDNSEDGTVQVSWTPPDKGHGLVRVYIVSKWFGSEGILNKSVHSL